MASTISPPTSTQPNWFPPSPSQPQSTTNYRPPSRGSAAASAAGVSTPFASGFVPPARPPNLSFLNLTTTTTTNTNTSTGPPTNGTPTSHLRAVTTGTLTPSPLAQEYMPDQRQQPQFPARATSPGGIGAVPSPHGQDHARPPSSSGPGTGQGHSRASSFFSSFRSHKNTNQEAQPQRIPSMSKTHSGVAGGGGSNGYGNVNGHVNEFGGTTTGPQQQQQAQQQTNGQPINRTRTTSNPSSPSSQHAAQAAPAPLHPEIRSIVQLTVAHAHKIYFSGPLVRRIERLPDGHHPAKDEGWTDVWAQLGGTTLSVWDMRQIEEANKQGKEVPPTYINMTDAFVQVLGSVTVPATPTMPAKRYMNVLTLNTAGSNLILFSCPSTAALMSWAAALRLSAWEKSRLEEIYTAHLLRITLNARDYPTTLLRGKLEGWVRVRIAGQTDWKRFWMVISAGGETYKEGERPPSSAGTFASSSPLIQSKKRRRSFFSRTGSQADLHAGDTASTTGHPLIMLCSSQKPKDKKKPALIMHDVTQAFAVYPERPELISRSTLIKMEGTYGDEESAGVMKNREGWMLVMPEIEGGLAQAGEMLKWVIGLHDAFELYGRPQAWIWDPRDPTSMMFAYPVGPHKDLLFLDREVAETMDPRDDRTSAIRSRLLAILADRMRTTEQPPHPPASTPPRTSSDGPPSLPPISLGEQEQPNQAGGYQLPPLSFDAAQNQNKIQLQERHQLTPIKEASSSIGHRGMSGDQSVLVAQPAATIPEEQGETSASESVLAEPERRTTSPAPAVPEKEKNVNVNVSVGRNLSATAASVLSPATTNESGMTSRFGELPRPGGSMPAVGSMDSMVIGPSPANVQLPISPVEEKSDPSTSAIPNSASTASLRGVALQDSPTPRSPNASIFTSPHSPAPSPKKDASVSRASIATSVLTSPHSPMLEAASLSQSKQDQHHQSISSVSSSTATPRPPSPQQSQSQSHALMNEPAALYYIQQAEDTSKTSPPRRQGTPMTLDQLPTLTPPSQPSDRQSPPSRPTLGRKPSGARAPAVNSSRPLYNADSALPSQHEQHEQSDEEQDGASMEDLRQRVDGGASGQPAQSAGDDSNLDALAALSYLDVKDEEAESPRPPPKVVVEPLKTKNVSSRPSVSPPPASPPGTNITASNDAGVKQYKSSFAPSKQAAERKAKAQAQQAAHHAATHKPGRANGKRKSKVPERAAWNESSEEEEEEEEEEDADSDAEPSPARQPSPNAAVRASQMPEVQAPAPLSHLRPPRVLPQIPGNRPHPDADDYHHPQPRRVPSDQYNEGFRRTYHEEGAQIRSQAEFPQPGAARQTMWSQVLDPGRNVVPEQTQHRPETFVQLESPSQAMTKAFTPQGLLSAGLQDKQDRSAKRQEELARESGASLINVPNKPPPPQTGLLGAITAHERERKREGGVGAALTEREREKRLAEERQRRFDEQQRQQLDQIQAGGSLYGAGQFGFNPMMNPMMMGMGMNGMNMTPPMMGLSPMMTGAGMGGVNPMMTGGFGMPVQGMMGGFNPQHMYAAQQAAQAYQQAMMAFSVAGSQAGPDGAAGTGAGMGQMNPMLTGYDPRMSMMGMGMMGGAPGGPAGGMGNMGSVPNMNVGMGMVGMGGMGPLGMPSQMTGMSGFDPRFTPGSGMNTGNASPDGQGLLTPSGLGAGLSRTSSPARGGSPLAAAPMNSNLNTGANANGKTEKEREQGSRPESPKT